ncbi:MAG TPA: hypothetical protein VGN26_02315 [Armatimonadota bacterium]
MGLLGQGLWVHNSGGCGEAVAGVYWFEDLVRGGKYAGSTIDKGRRFAEHMADGRLGSVEEAHFVPVPGGKFAREAGEQALLEHLREAGDVANIRNPLGRMRRKRAKELGLLEDPFE